MQDRHSNKAQYFTEQSVATERYIFPYINEILPISPDLNVAEIGCGYGGNLKPFLERGCSVVGIDLSPYSIELAETFYENDKNRNNLQLLARDIYKIRPEELPTFDLIFMRDTLEHIHNQEHFLQHVKSFLKPEGKLFLAFPPWTMPFGGHQQMCKSKFLSKLPYFHILPKSIYKGILKLFGEKPPLINSLMEVKETKISLRKFYKIAKKHDFTIEKQTFYLINPNYEIKFGKKPRILPRVLNIPVIREFFITTYYCILKIC
jgi:SAM-dependent methyltransferase